MKSYYEILGISNTADAVTIKQAYRSLVKKYHPDIYKGDDRDTKFQEIQTAYDVLSDEDKRAAYDRNGHASYEQSQKYGTGGFGTGGFGPGYQDFSGFGGFNTYTTKTKQMNFSELSLGQKLLMIMGIVILAIIGLIGFIITAIVKIIVSIINQIFK